MALTDNFTRRNLRWELASPVKRCFGRNVRRHDSHSSARLLRAATSLLWSVRFEVMRNNLITVESDEFIVFGANLNLHRDDLKRHIDLLRLGTVRNPDRIAWIDT